MKERLFVIREAEAQALLRFLAHEALGYGEDGHTLSAMWRRLVRWVKQ